MGKASSAKKVAKAARAGGSGSGVRQRNLLFPGLIGVVVILGLALIAFARSDYQSKVFDVEPLVGETHWHAAFGVYICDEFIPVNDQFDSQLGIHSHGDEVLHIHPTSRNASGENAQLGVYFDESPLIDVSNDEITVADQTWKEGEDTCNGEDAEVIGGQWLDATEGGDPAIIESGFKDLRFRDDGEAYVVAFVPRGEREIPLPERSMAQLAQVNPGLAREDIYNDPGQAPQIDPEGLPEGVNPEDLFPEGTAPAEGEGSGSEGSGSEGSEGQDSGEEGSDAGDSADANSDDGG